MTYLPYYRLTVRPMAGGFAPCFERLVVDGTSRQWRFVKLAGKIHRSAASARRHAEFIGAEYGHKIV